MDPGTSLRHLFLVLQLGECSDSNWDDWERQIAGGGRGRAAATSSPDRPLFFRLAMLPAASGTQEKYLVLGKAGDLAELPCHSSQKKNLPFSWKNSDQIKILRSHRNLWHKGRLASLLVLGGKPQGLTPLIWKGGGGSGFLFFVLARLRAGCGGRVCGE